VLEWEEALVSSWEPESSSHPGSTTYQRVFIIHFSTQQKLVFLMHDSLVWIRIRRSMPLTNGSGFGSGSPVIFVIDLLDANKN